MSTAEMLCAGFVGKIMAVNSADSSSLQVNKVAAMKCIGWRSGLVRYLDVQD
jgi:hypothetical protein